MDYNKLSSKKCFELINYDGLFIKHLNKSQRTHCICKEAAKIDGLALRFLRELQRTEKVCWKAIKYVPKTHLS